MSTIITDEFIEVEKKLKTAADQHKRSGEMAAYKALDGDVNEDRNARAHRAKSEALDQAILIVADHRRYVASRDQKIG